MPEKNKPVLGDALVGLGKYSGQELAPALEKTRFCKLVGVVTGDKQKAADWRKKYNLPETNVYNYKTFDSIKDNDHIDVVYIVLPNSMHAEFAIRAAKAGKHVICEKPMATSVQDCEKMIRACDDAGVLLSIGYRLHFEPHNLTVASVFRENAFGPIKRIVAKHGMDIEPNVWRLNRMLAGGGPLMDVGIYCIQAAIYTSGKNPVAVSATEGKKTDFDRFKEVEQSLRWTMHFADGTTADCETSYSEEHDLLRVESEDEWITLSPAYAYEGIKASLGNGEMGFAQINQQARQMDDFAQCIQKGIKSKVAGEMGLRDVKIILAVYEAAKTGKKISLDLQ
jgi:predicted dehydrogenase